MSTWLDLNEEIEIFECPFCRKHVSSNNKICPKCSFEFTDEIKKSAINLENEKIKEISRKYYKPSIYVGIIFLAISLGIPLLTIFKFGWSGDYWEGLINILPYAVVGIIALTYGLRGLHNNK